MHKNLYRAQLRNIAAIFCFVFLSGFGQESHGGHPLAAEFISTGKNIIEKIKQDHLFADLLSIDDIEKLEELLTKVQISVTDTNLLLEETGHIQWARHTFNDDDPENPFHLIELYEKVFFQ